MPLKVLVPALVMTAVAASSAHADGDAAKGQQVFSRCAICHDTAPGRSKIGPSLAGIVGRKSASAADFKYSEAMKGYGKVWDAATLDTYIASPRQAVPGTKMVFAGLKDAKDRTDLVAYLATLK